MQINKSLKQAIYKVRKNDTIIHFHGGFIPQFFKIAKLLKKLNIPYFFTPHGAYNLKALKKSRFKKKVFIQFFEKGLVNNSIGTQILGRTELDGLNTYFNKKLENVICHRFQNSDRLEEIYGELKFSGVFIPIK